MNSNYLEDYLNIFEKILSVGYQYDYSTSFIERTISYSSFFLNIEKDSSGYYPLAGDSYIVNEFYYNPKIDMSSLPTYNQCLWAAEAYLRIQGSSKLPFECIFLYIPIKQMYEYFPLYHEMGFSHIINRFNELYAQKSVFAILLSSYKYSLKDISEKVDTSYETLFSLKQRKRDIKKANVELIIKLAKIFNVRIETIAEIQIV